jgi:hypothetical protein
MALTGYERVIDPPPLRPRPWGTFQRSALPLDAPDRWELGVTFQSYGCDDLERFDTSLCEDATLDVTPHGGIEPFAAFTILSGDECSALNHQVSELEARISAVMNAKESKQLAAEFETSSAAGNVGLVNNPNVTLLTAGVGLDPLAALSLIEQGLADCLDGGQGMIHVTPAMLVYLDLYGGLEREGSVWYTATGHILVGDAGTQGLPPAGEPPLAAGEEYMYGTGLVQFELGAPFWPTRERWESMNFAHNDQSMRMVKWALVVFDPCCEVAARALFPCT